MAERRSTGQPPGEPRRILYGRRGGRRLRAGHRRLFDTLFPHLELKLAPEGGLLDPTALLPGPTRRLWLEIGFGAGEHLIAQAKANPDIGLIGCEPYVNGIARLLTAIEAEKLDNIRILQDDARLLLDCLPDASLNRVFIMFPDPWPKQRHHKRRIVCLTVLRGLARLLEPGGELRMATDHAGYLDWMLEHARASGAFEWTAGRPADWRSRPADWPETRYEAKAIAAGRSCAYLRFKRRPAPPTGALSNIKDLR